MNTPRQNGLSELPKTKEDEVKHVSWRDLPRKGQLLVIVLTRLSEPLTQTSLQSYMYFQLKSFDSSLSDSAISRQMGLLQASFTAAQFLTAMLWGRVADSARFGRKTVVLMGLGGTVLSCTGFGLSTTFRQALFFRCIGGITNGNVGVLRTMMSETVREKKYHSRAFLLLPMTFNIGVMIGPILGGMLSDPAGSYPSLFGQTRFFLKFPYAAPNLVSAFFLFCAMMTAWLCLEETLDSRLDRDDFGLMMGSRLSSALRSCIRACRKTAQYEALPSSDVTEVEKPQRASPGLGRQDSITLSGSDTTKPTRRYTRRYTQRLPFRRIFTRNVVLTFLANCFHKFHVGTFNSLWVIFLSTPVYDHARDRRLPFFFTGGLGLQPQQVGVAMAILGFMGIGLQLFVYPRLSARLGVLRSLRTFLLFFPVTYLIAPFLSLIPSSTPSPGNKLGLWMAMVGVLLVQVIGRTFTVPSIAILVNNCTPHPSVLATVHGVAHSVGSLGRTLGPALGGYLYGFGLEIGVVGVVFWCFSFVAICGAAASLLVREGDGHEIWLEGDEE